MALEGRETITRPQTIRPWKRQRAAQKTPMRTLVHSTHSSANTSHAVTAARPEIVDLHKSRHLRRLADASANCTSRKLIGAHLEGEAIL
jgi:hypothetical protein